MVKCVDKERLWLEEYAGRERMLPLFCEHEDLENVVDTSDTWIRERTGIARRHIAVEDTAVTMAVKAARQALANGKIDPEAVELILVSTISPERFFPARRVKSRNNLELFKQFALI